MLVSDTSGWADKRIMCTPAGELVAKLTYIGKRGFFNLPKAWIRWKFKRNGKSPGRDQRCGEEADTSEAPVNLTVVDEN